MHVGLRQARHNARRSKECDVKAEQSVDDTTRGERAVVTVNARVLYN
jgi:hypothetical protein